MSAMFLDADNKLCVWSPKYNVFPLIATVLNAYPPAFEPTDSSGMHVFFCCLKGKDLNLQWMSKDREGQEDNGYRPGDRDLIFSS